MTGGRGWSSGCCLGAAGRRLAAWALLRAWALGGGGEVAEGFEEKDQLGLCVEWVGEADAGEQGQREGAHPRGGCCRRSWLRLSQRPRSRPP